MQANAHLYINKPASHLQSMWQQTYFLLSTLLSPQIATDSSWMTAIILGMNHEMPMQKIFSSLTVFLLTLWTNQSSKVKQISSSLDNSLVSFSTFLVPYIVHFWTSIGSDKRGCCVYMCMCVCGNEQRECWSENTLLFVAGHMALSALPLSMLFLYPNWTRCSNSQ